MTGSRVSVLFLATLVGLVGASPAWPATKGTSADAAKPLKVLFIGNSLTSVNDLPAMLKSLAAHAEKPLLIEYDAVLAGGATLKNHWDKGEALAKIRQGGWDYVVLQDQSTIALREKESMFQHVRLFDAEIKKAGAKTLLYMTWALKKSPETQAAITAAYNEIGREVGARVVAVGQAREEAQKSDGAPDLYVSDGKHPAPAGTYLAACLFYAELSGRSPLGLPASLPDAKDAKLLMIRLINADAALLQRSAAKVFRDSK